MKRSDITDRMVCDAYRRRGKAFADEFLAAETGAPLKVARAAIARAFCRGLLDSGISDRTGWLTEKGLELLNNRSDDRKTLEGKSDK